jgi:hypothetical protein
MAKSSAENSCRSVQLGFRKYTWSVICVTFACVDILKAELHFRGWCWCWCYAASLPDQHMRMQNQWLDIYLPTVIFWIFASIWLVRWKHWTSSLRHRKHWNLGLVRIGSYLGVETSEAEISPGVCSSADWSLRHCLGWSATFPVSSLIFSVGGR